MPAHDHWYLPLQVVAMQIRMAMAKRSLRPIVAYREVSELKRRQRLGRTKFAFTWTVFNLHVSEFVRNHPEHEEQLRTGPFADALKLILDQNVVMNLEENNSLGKFQYALELVYDGPVQYRGGRSQTRIKRVTLIQFTPPIEHRETSRIDLLTAIPDNIPYVERLVWTRRQSRC